MGMLKTVTIVAVLLASASIASANHGNSGRAVVQQHCTDAGCTKVAVCRGADGR
jgi:hypothetical protein